MNPLEIWRDTCTIRPVSMRFVESSSFYNKAGLPGLVNLNMISSYRWVDFSFLVISSIWESVSDLMRLVYMRRETWHTSNEQAQSVSQDEKQLNNIKDSYLLNCIFKSIKVINMNIITKLFSNVCLNMTNSTMNVLMYL